MPSTPVDMYFDITVQDPCEIATRSFSPIVLIDRSYNLYTPPVTYTWDKTTEVSSSESEALCGDWDFTIQMHPSLDPLLTPPFTTGLPSTLDYIIETSETSLVGEYDLVVTAWQGSYVSQSIQRVWKVSIINPCAMTTITASSPFGIEQYYWYSKPQITRPFDIFIPNDSFCPMTYSLSLQDGNPYDDTLISEDLASQVMQLSW